MIITRGNRTHGSRALQPRVSWQLAGIASLVYLLKQNIAALSN